MSSIYRDILSNEELFFLNNLPEVLAAKASLDLRTSGMVYFSVHITNEIQNTLQSQFGLQLSAGSSIPMRWIKGDTAPHVDVGSSKFQNTYLMYLNNSPGEIVIDSQSYPIEANTGFIFNEGLSHATQNTENVPRLLLGPMNELAEPVGFAVYLYYYPTEDDARDDTNILVSSPSYIVGDGVSFGGYKTWMISSRSTGTSPQNVVYPNGSVLDSGDNSYYYYLYPYRATDPLGAFLIYFATQEHAEYPNPANVLGYSTSYKIGEDVEGGPFPQYTSWMISSSEFNTGTSSKNVVYQNGSILESLEGAGTPYLYFLYPAPQRQPSILRMSLYTNNSQVYYKSNSLSSGIGSVRNHRAKKYRT
jgi:hypothetical protein